MQPHGTAWTPRYLLDSQVGDGMLEIEPTTWARAVLPGLGVQSSRWVELRIPGPLPDSAPLRAGFDSATRSLSSGAVNGPSECVAACRAILAAWEQHLGASSKDGSRVADQIGTRCSWAPGDPRRKWLDEVWKGMHVLSDDAHHPENQVAAIDYQTARALLLQVATVSDYLARVVGG